MLDHQHNLSAKVHGINKLDDLIEYESLRSELEYLLGYATRDASEGDRRPFGPVLTLKVLILQKYHTCKLARMQQIYLQIGVMESFICAGVISSKVIRKELEPTMNTPTMR